MKTVSGRYLGQVTTMVRARSVSASSVSAGEASTRLRPLSQREPVKVAEVAAGIVQAAVHRAQARRRTGPDLCPGAPFVRGG